MVKKPLSNRGFSDDHEGVQWNIRVHPQTGETFSGVNLESMKYSDWPIANLLTREKSDAKLIGFVTIAGADEIRVGLYRNAWQATARPPIKERNIEGSGTLLSKMTQSLWAAMLGQL